MTDRDTLRSLLGQWVTVKNPDLPASWYGRLTALADEPSLVLTTPGAGQACLSQTFTVTPAEPPAPGVLDPRQPAYDAVFDVIRSMSDDIPETTAHRNAMIWHGVHAALDTLGISQRHTPQCHSTDTAPASEDMSVDTVPAQGGHVRTPVTVGEDGCALALPDTIRGHPEVSEDTGGDTRPGGVRFAYTASVRRGQVRHAITEAFELLDGELHPGRDHEEGGHRDV